VISPPGRPLWEVIWSWPIANETRRGSDNAVKRFTGASRAEILAFVLLRLTSEFRSGSQLLSVCLPQARRASQEMCPIDGRSTLAFPELFGGQRCECNWRSHLGAGEADAVLSGQVGGRPSERAYP
jgi:hypothetical protein